MADQQGSNSTPRWVKVCGIVAGTLLLLFVISHLTGHGFGGHALHGGGR
jgi:hypothetical protein